ncbi:unnamed protein product [Leptidea sinapis]|uniref:RNA helicase n=1 Tax=Leptidea sinapis TaxID=189913 RepID=A0A5E4R6N4_9NEOP|nr:unnamed protein product [Leptidea sinapis]
MDSKYASFGKEKQPTNHFEVKAKRLKLCLASKKISNEKEQNPNSCNGHINVIKSNNKQNNVSENNIQEIRKSLPVYLVRARILDEIRKHPTMILIGETGSGKTTQIPQLIHEQRIEGGAAIAVTQPRRVAAITLAQRVAAEMNTDIGSIVGYSVRFEDVTSHRTKVIYLTDGMLLREAIVDPLLMKYSVIILDEAHERTVNTDVLFGIVKLAQEERKSKLNKLKVIIMSATMDVDTFRNYYDNCPVIYLEGRTYPVTIYHSKMKQDDYQYAVVCAIFQLHVTTPANHDFLVFLTGQEEIETVTANIKQIAKESPGPQIRVCQLYAGLPASKQLLVWKTLPPGIRKIVLATNIAEASVTIPQIKCVIDSGMVKQRSD